MPSAKAPPSDPPPDMALKPSRSARIDTFRGILILLVVFGHALQFITYHGREDYWADPLFTAIYMVHMPLFMAVSGWLAPRKALGVRAILARARLLIWPMVPGSILLSLLRAGAQNRFGELPQMILGDFLIIFWFLWAAFLCFLLLAAMLWFPLWLAPRYASLAGVALGLGVMVWLLGAPEGWRLVLSRTGFVLPFFFAGWLARGWLQSQSRSRWPATFLPALPWAMAPLAVTAYVFWQPETYIYNNHADAISNPAQVGLMYLGAASASILAFGLLWPLAKSLSGRLAQGLALLGQHTLQIYVIQEIAYAILRAIATNIPGAGAGFSPTGLATALFITCSLTALIQAFVTLTQRNTRLRNIGLSTLLWGQALPASSQTIPPPPRQINAATIASK